MTKYEDLEDALYLLFTNCTRAYKASSEKNVLTENKFNNTYIFFLATLAYGRYENFLKEYKKVASVIEAPLKKDNVNEKVEVCNKYFDGYKTAPELVLGLGKQLMGISDDTNAAIQQAYTQNLETYKSGGCQENPEADLILYFVTLGLLPSDTVSECLTKKEAADILVENLPKMPTLTAKLDVENIPQRLVLITRQIKEQKPAKKPQVSTISYQDEIRSIAESILDHCKRTVYSLGLPVPKMLENLNYESLSRTLQQVEQTSSISDLKSTAQSLIDEIDCQTDLLPYLRSPSGYPLTGVALYNSFGSFVSKVIECTGTSAGNPEKFKNCLRGTVTEKSAEEVISQHQANISAYGLDWINDILEKAGLQPFETSEEATAFVNFIAKLMKSRGVTTKNYQELQNVLVAKKSEIEEILNKLPENERKKLIDIISQVPSLPEETADKVLSTLANIFDLPEKARNEALTYIYNVVQLGNSVLDTEYYYSQLDRLLNNLSRVSTNLSKSLTQINSFLSYLRNASMSLEEKEKIINALASDPDYIVGYIQKMIGTETAPQITPTRPTLEEETVERPNIISNRDDLISLLYRIVRLNNLKLTKIDHNFADIDEAEGYVITDVIYFSYSQASETNYYLAFPSINKIYMINKDTEFGQKVIDACEKVLNYVRQQYYPDYFHRYGVVGMNMDLFLVVKSKKKGYGGTVYFLDPKYINAHSKLYLVFSKFTMPMTYERDLFKDVVDDMGLHLLVDVNSPTYTYTIYLVTDQPNLTKDAVYKPVLSSIYPTEWSLVYQGEITSGKGKA